MKKKKKKKKKKKNHTVVEVEEVVVVLLNTVGNNVRKFSKPIPAVEWVWKNYGHLFSTKPPTSFQSTSTPTSLNLVRERYHSDYNLINYCAKRYQTCFINNLKLNFISRQRRAIRASLAGIDGKDKPKQTLVYALQCLINNWIYNGRTYSESQLLELRNQHSDWIQKHRSVLPFERLNIINENNLQLCEFIRYYAFLKREYAEHSTKLKNIPLVPQNDTKVHNVDFDAAGVKGLCHEIQQKKLE